jgi:large subunit ribosomal protein L35Ae
MVSGERPREPTREESLMPASKASKGRTGSVISYRRGKHLQHFGQVILEFDTVDSKDAAAALVGRNVKWVSPSGIEFLGKVLGAHGNSGAVRAKFRTNLPGQALGTPVILL